MSKKLVGALALVLAGVLVYYNFIDKKTPGVEVGDKSPDFTVATMSADGETFAMTDEEYNLYANAGKVRVVNFWATWCAACKHELPDFDRFAKAYPEVEVIAVCGSSGSEDVVISWMNNDKQDAQKNGWSDYSLIFGFYDESKDQNVYETMGGQSMWPMTVVVDENGTICYSAEVALTYEDLQGIVLPLLKD